MPQCLRAFCNGLLRFTRNDGLFTTHHSRLTQTAFTLAETLIVIGIIGVVAALTLPNLNHATGDKEKVTKVKKIYSSLTDAVDRAQVIYGDFDTWFNDIEEDTAACNERFAKRVTEFMKVSKDCGNDLNKGCVSVSSGIVRVTGEAYKPNAEELQNNTAYTVALSDGISLIFGIEFVDDGAIAEIITDIDGPNKGKNQYGNDWFYFTMYTSKTFADGSGALLNQLYPGVGPIGLTGNLQYDGNFITAWVIENGNLDYLKSVEGENGWKCPDGELLISF